MCDDGYKIVMMITLYTPHCIFWLRNVSLFLYILRFLYTVKQHSLVSYILLSLIFNEENNGKKNWIEKHDSHTNASVYYTYSL